MSRSRSLTALLCFSLATLLAQISSTAVGHQFRQDDWPSIASAPDGSMWIAWLSFVGDRDDVVIRHHKDGTWGNLQCFPRTSGDIFLPSCRGCLWVVWSQPTSAIRINFNGLDR